MNSSIGIVIGQLVGNLLSGREANPKDPKMSMLAQLHQAVSADDVKVLSTLVQSGANVNSVYQQETAFTRALDLDHLRSAEIILAAPKFNPNAKNQFDRTPLFVAAKQGYPDFVRRLVSMGAEVNVPDVRGVTPIAACAWKDNHEAADILINHGADLNQEDVMGQSPIFRACSNVSINVARLLVKHGCNVNLPSKEGKSPLMEALPNYYSYKVAGKKISDMLEICKLLVEARCNVDYQDLQGKTALHHALDSNDQYGLCLLAESGAHLDIKDNKGYTPFQSAILSKRPRYEAARFLLYYGADAGQKMPNSDGENGDENQISPLSFVLKSKLNDEDLESRWSRSLLLRSLWAAVYPDSKYRQKDGMKDFQQCHNPDSNSNMSFHDMIERDIIEWLHSCTPCTLQHQAKLAVRSRLHTRNILPKIRLLPIGSCLQKDLSLGLDASKIPLSAICHLHCCIADGDTEKVRELVDNGVDVNFSINNKTPLALAIETGNDEIVSILLSSLKHRSQTVVNPDGDSVLHVAAKYGRDSVVSDVIETFGDLNIKNSVGYTPLQEAVIAGHFDIAVKLVKCGADTTMSSSENIPAIPIMHIAAGSGAKDMVELLLEKGESPNQQDKFGNTPLHVAASKGAEYLRRGISLPALYEDPGSANVDAVRMMLTGGQPLLAKRLPGHVMVAMILLQAGADVTKLNDDNRTPLMCAAEVRALDMEEILAKKNSVVSD